MIQSYILMDHSNGNPCSMKRIFNSCLLATHSLLITIGNSAILQNLSKIIKIMYNQLLQTADKKALSIYIMEMIATVGARMVVESIIHLKRLTK